MGKHFPEPVSRRTAPDGPNSTAKRSEETNFPSDRTVFETGPTWNTARPRTPPSIIRSTLRAPRLQIGRPATSRMTVVPGWSRPPAAKEGGQTCSSEPESSSRYCALSSLGWSASAFSSYAAGAAVTAKMMASSAPTLLGSCSSLAGSAKVAPTPPRREQLARLCPQVPHREQFP